MAQISWQQLASRANIKAWEDPTFKSRLLANPSPALAELNADIPTGIEIHVEEANSVVPDKLWKRRNNTVNLYLEPNPVEGDPHLQKLLHDEIDYDLDSQSLGTQGCKTTGCSTGKGC